MFFKSLSAAFRATIRHRTQSFICISGFAIALTVVMFIGLYAHRELTVNMQHQKAECIYKISGWGAPYAMGSFIKERVPEFESVVTVLGMPKQMLPVTHEPKGKQEVQVEGYMMVSDVKEFFNIFDFPLLVGDKNDPLPDINSVILSQSAAKTLFVDGVDPVGKQIYVGSEQPLTVTGITADASSNATIRYSVLARINEKEYINQQGTTVRDDWESFSFECFATLRPSMVRDSVQTKMQKILKDEGHMTYDVGYVALYSLHDVYFKELWGRFGGGSYSQVMAMIWVGLIILMLAIINFFNLSSANATMRTKEIGMRKVSGSSRRLLALQFLCESVIQVTISILIAIIIINLLIEPFSGFVGGHFEPVYMSKLWQWEAVLVLILGVGLIAGSYPALYLSGFRPLDVLFSKRVVSSKSVVVFRKVLIIVSLVFTTGVIFATLVVSNQLSYMKTTDMGFNKEQMICVWPSPQTAMSAFDSKLMALPYVEGVSVTGNLLGKGAGGLDMFAKYQNEEKKIWVKHLVADTAFIHTFDMKMNAGRNFMGSEEQTCALVSKEAMRQLGFDDYQQLTVSVDDGKTMLKVVGVLEDFHIYPMNHVLEPVIVVPFPVQYRGQGLYNVRLSVSSMTDIEKVFADLKRIHIELGGTSENYQMPKLMDDELATAYRKEETFLVLFSIFTTLSIIISCFGLFGLIVFANARRRKEIALRRVAGARVGQVVGLLVRTYILPIIISYIVAIPMAYYAMSIWLESYPYKAEMSLWIWALPLMFVTIVVMLTVGLHSLWSATRNPVKSLGLE